MADGRGINSTTLLSLFEWMNAVDNFHDLVRNKYKGGDVSALNLLALWSIMENVLDKSRG